MIVVMFLFSIPVTHISHTGNKQKQNSHLKTRPNDHELSQDNVDRKKQQENELPQQQNVQEPEELGQESADTCTSTLTLFRVILCLMLLYEYHFDFIDHLPIQACSHRLVLAVIFRVQSSLIILSMYLLHPKIVSSLIFTFNSANVESDFALKTLQPASVGNFFHIFRLRTNKHKKQQLVLMKNWKSALNRILNFKKRFSKHFHTNKDTNQTREKQPHDHVSQQHFLALAETLIHYLTFSLSVIFLPGLIFVFLVLPKIQIFAKLLYNLPRDFLDKMAMNYSHLFNQLQHLFVGSVILGNVAINSFVTALC